MTIPESQELLSPLQPGAINVAEMAKFIAALCTKADVKVASNLSAAVSMTAWMKDLRDNDSLGEMVKVMEVAARTLGQLSENGHSDNGRFLLQLALITGIGIGWLTGREQALVTELEKLINGRD